MAVEAAAAAMSNIMRRFDKTRKFFRVTGSVVRMNCRRVFSSENLNEIASVSQRKLFKSERIGVGSVLNRMFIQRI